MATILVVDDEFGVGEVLDTILTDAGHRVLTAINGKQGLARLVETTPDVVLLDFMMPLLDGPGMLRAMAADPAHRDIPVIMMSSLDADTVAEKCGRYVAFLRKPFRAKQVIDIVARALDDSAEQRR
jgi:CheY-like chemotaxis protein